MTAARYRAACARLGLPVWRPGMLAVRADPKLIARFIGHDIDEVEWLDWSDDADDPIAAAEPDFTDPATVGCLLAAVHKALCAAFPAAECIDMYIFDDGAANLNHDHGIGDVSGATLADALIAALEAAAARRGGQP